MKGCIVAVAVASGVIDHVAGLEVLGPAPQTPSPLNGAPFQADVELSPLVRLEPPPWTIVYEPGVFMRKKDNANSCMATPAADKNTCLGNADRDCMFVLTEGTDPATEIQRVERHCMPCELDGAPVACWNVGAMVGDMVVRECEMMCPHQLKIREPEYTCSDESGFISEAECFDRGTRSGSSCMHLALRNAADGSEKSQCAPCHVEGTGSWSCPEPGTPLDADGWQISKCASQCNRPGPSATGVVEPVHPNPGLTTTRSDPDTMVDAPAPRSMTYSANLAAALRAR